MAVLGSRCESGVGQAHGIGAWPWRDLSPGSSDSGICALSHKYVKYDLQVLVMHGGLYLERPVAFARNPILKGNHLYEP